MPLDEAFKFISETTGLEIEIDPKLTADGVDRTPINLRVSDMHAELAIAWILRLAEVSYEKTTEEPRKIRIVK
jgi:hypothetical protein